MPSVLIVDDQSTGRMILEEVVRTAEQAVAVHSFADPVQALQWAKGNPVDLILTDYKMPNMDGSEFVRWLRQIPSCADIPVVVITVVEDRAVRYKALAAGATDFLTKPIDHQECRARCRNLLLLRRQQQIVKDRAKWLERKVEDAVQEIAVRETETLLRLARAGEYRDEGTGNHVLRMARFSRLIAESLGLEKDECHVIEQASPMHDIGKIGIPDQILLKPGKLDGAERQVMDTHTTIGFQILRDSPSRFLQAGAVIALRHHERFDGSGYPDGIGGREIPLKARIVAVADVYDALMSDRPYKSAWPIQEALDYLTREKGKHFDPECVDAFMGRLDHVVRIQQELRDAQQRNSS